MRGVRIPQDGPVELEAEWLPFITLRVLDRESGEHLSALEIHEAIGADSPSAITPDSDWIVSPSHRGLSSPYELAPVRLVRKKTRRTYWVRSSGYAWNAIALEPDVPQFIVTHVLTDSSLWKIEGDGTARMNFTAAERLLAVRHHLRDMSGHARKLGQLLYTIIRDDDDPDYPFVLTDYHKFLKNPRMALTRPDEGDFDIAQNNLVEKIRALRKKLEGQD